jgi:S-formylglutathione hydrolase
MLDKGTIETSLVTGPVDYTTLRAGSGPSSELPIVLWLHGGGGSSRFLETCQAQFVACWAESSLPDLVAVTPSAGWSLYLDRFDGSEQWETFLLDELVPHIRKQTGSTAGPLVLGGISVGALASLRMAFRRPELIRAVLAVEPTIEAALRPEDVPLRDRVHLPAAVRRRLFGDPIDPGYWLANHPPELAGRNGAAIAAARTAIYLECGDQDQFHAQYGAELLHRRLFDVGISHEYRLVRGANHVGPTVGPRIHDALRFLGRVLKRSQVDTQSLDAIVEVETFAARVKELEQAAGYRQQVEVQGPSCPLTVHAQGQGPRIVLLPSLGRGAADFADLADRLARAGNRVLRPEPRGVGGSSRSLQGLSLDDFADDVAAVIDACGGPAVLVGHDFGGQVAQMVACLYPDLVASLVLVACPGPIQPKPEPATALRRVFIQELSDEEHLEAIALALFSPGNDPVAWMGGWHPMLAFAQAEAERQVAVEELWGKLRTDTLVIQPADDLIVLPENAELMAQTLGELATVVSIPGAGHALLPEQPEAVAVAILSWVRSRR